MEDTAKKTKPRGPYRYHADTVWALAQERYLAGESAPRIAEALGMTEHAIRGRITREGWSKRAQAEAMADGIVAAARAETTAGLAGPADGVEALEPRAAARAALEAAARLMRGGRMAAAGEAARVADVMARAAARLGDAAPVEAEEPDEAAFEAVRRKVLGISFSAGGGAAAGAVCGPLDEGAAFGPLHHPSDGPPPPSGEE